MFFILIEEEVDIDLLVIKKKNETRQKQLY